MSSPPQISYSVIIPARNAAACLPRALSALRSAIATDSAELNVIDDASADGTFGIAEEYGAHVIKLPSPSGAATARNAGAEIARGAILIFIDADIEIHPDTVAQLQDALNDNPHVSAVFGSYDAAPADPHLVSTFRNLLHHYTHQQGRGQAGTFWTGCGAIRRGVFESTGPFSDASLFCMEDIDYGHRLRDAGHQILLCPEIQCKHLKRWTLSSMIKTDLTRRAIPWTIMTLRRRRADTTLNLAPRERLSAICALLFTILLVAAVLTLNPALAIISLLPLAGLLIIQHRFYRFLADRRNLQFATACIPLHIIYYLTALIGAITGTILHAVNQPAARNTGPARTADFPKNAGVAACTNHQKPRPVQPPPKI